MATSKTAATKTTTKATKTSANGQAPKVKAEANGEKRTSNYRADGGLTKAHVRLLTVLGKSKTPLTHGALAERLGAKHPKTVRWDLGSISADNRDPLSLMGRGAVKQTIRKVEQRADDSWITEAVYEVTASGKKALEREIKSQAEKAAAK